MLCPLLNGSGKPGDEGLRIDQAVRRALQGRPAHWQPRGRGPRLPVPRPAAHRDGRGARRPRHAAGHRLHLQPRRLRRRRAPGLRDGVRLTDAAERTAIRADRRAPGRAAGRRGPARPRLRRVARGPGAGRGGAPRRPGARLPRDGRGVLRRGVAQGGLRHRDAVPRHQHAGPLGGDRALHQIRQRGAGHAHLGGVPPADRAGRAARPRRRGPRRGGVVERDHLRRGGAGGGGPATRPAFRLPPTYNLAVNLVRGFDRATAHEVLHRSFAQWQARKPDLLSASSDTAWPSSRRWAMSTAGA